MGLPGAPEPEFFSPKPEAVEPPTFVVEIDEKQQPAETASDEKEAMVKPTDVAELAEAIRGLLGAAVEVWPALPTVAQYAAWLAGGLLVGKIVAVAT